MKTERKNKSLIKKLSDYFFGVGAGMFWLPAFFLALPIIVNSFSQEIIYGLFSLLLIPFFWIMIILVAYFSRGGTLRELFSNEN